MASRLFILGRVLRRPVHWMRCRPVLSHQPCRMFSATGRPRSEDPARTAPTVEEAAAARVSKSQVRVKRNEPNINSQMSKLISDGVRSGFDEADMLSEEMVEERQAVSMQLANLLSQTHWDLLENELHVLFAKGIRDPDKAKKMFTAPARVLNMSDISISLWITKKLGSIFHQRYLPSKILRLMCKHIRYFDLKELGKYKLESADGSYPPYLFAAVDDEVEPIMKTLGKKQVTDHYRSQLVVRSSFKDMSFEEDTTEKLQEELFPIVDRLTRNTYKVFVDNLHPDVTSRELMTAFQRCGDTVAVEIYRENIRTDLLNLHDRVVNPEMLIDGMEVHRKSRMVALIEKANKRREQRQGASITESMAKKHKKNREKYLRSLAGRSPVHAFVYFKTEEAQQRALVTSLQVFGVMVGQSMAQTEPAWLKKTLYLAHIPLGLTYGNMHSSLLDGLQGGGVRESDIVSFQGIRNLRKPTNESIKELHIPKSFLMVEFKTHEIALAAWRMLSHHRFLHVDHPDEDANKMPSIVLGWGTKQTKEYDFDLMITEGLQVDESGNAFTSPIRALSDGDEKVQPAWWQDYHEKMGDLAAKPSHHTDAMSADRDVTNRDAMRVEGTVNFDDVPDEEDPFDDADEFVKLFAPLARKKEKKKRGKPRRGWIPQQNY